MKLDNENVLSFIFIISTAVLYIFTYMAVNKGTQWLSNAINKPRAKIEISDNKENEFYSVVVANKKHIQKIAGLKISCRECHY